MFKGKGLHFYKFYTSIISHWIEIFTKVKDLNIYILIK